MDHGTCNIDVGCSINIQRTDGECEFIPIRDSCVRCVCVCVCLCPVSVCLSLSLCLLSLCGVHVVHERAFRGRRNRCRRSGFLSVALLCPPSRSSLAPLSLVNFENPSAPSLYFFIFLSFCLYYCRYNKTFIVNYNCQISFWSLERRFPRLIMVFLLSLFLFLLFRLFFSTLASLHLSLSPLSDRFIGASSSICC